MEKLMKPYDKEYMKMAMLKHEQTFRQQVYELHRLYRIQKMLMKRIEKSREWDCGGGVGLNQVNAYDNRLHTHQNPRPGIDLEQPAEEYTAESDGDGEREIQDESSIRLTLGPTSYYERKKADTPRNSESGYTLSSSSSGSSHVKMASSEIHEGTYRRRDELRGRNWELRNSFGVEEGLNQEGLKQPPWLFQALGLNMT